MNIIIELMAICKHMPTDNYEVNFAFGSKKLPKTMKEKIAKLRRQWKKK